jgi:predicted AAA+ superfamily ATPase
VKSLQNGNMSGAIFETYVVTEIIKSYINSRKKLNLYYYRDIDKKEIDLLIVNGDSIIPIEIKKNKSPENASKNFSVLSKFKMKVGKGIIICLAQDFLPYDKTSEICPVGAIL